jgi:hypothetical protein
MKSRTSDANLPATRIFSISWGFLMCIVMIAAFKLHLSLFFVLL